MKVNKEKVKSVVKKAVVLIAASLATISLFACGGKTETKMEYPSISIDQDVNTRNDSKVKVMEEVVKPTEIKETKKYVEETTKPVETTEPAPITPSISREKEREELKKMLGLDKNDDEQKTGTDAKGRPYLQKGQEYTWSASGEPNEAPGPYSADSVVNPNNGKKYGYIERTSEWVVDTREQDAEIAKQYMEGKVDLYGNPVEKRKPTEEEARRWAKMFSDSFK